MKVITAKSAGFCFGVKNAVQTANKMAEQHREGERLIMLGELTHKRRLSALGPGGLRRIAFQGIRDHK